jgi:hypothetical protein
MIPVELADWSAGYTTPEAAIAAAKNHPQQAKARRDAKACSGRTFIDARGDAQHWVIEFSGDVWLRVWVDGASVDWAVERQRPPRTAAAEPLVLQWPSGATSRTDPATLSRPRRGAEFWQFWVNDMGFHLYLHGQRILCFSLARRRDSGDPILWVWEDD